MPTTTITYSVAEGQRMAVAFGKYWQLKDANGNPRNATEPEIKAYLIRQAKGVVLNVERATAEAAVTPPDPFEPT